MKETQTFLFFPKFYFVLHVTARLDIFSYESLLSTFYVLTFISKNITIRAYADRTVLKKLNLIMMESRKRKTRK